MFVYFINNEYCLFSYIFIYVCKCNRINIDVYFNSTISLNEEKLC